MRKCQKCGRIMRANAPEGMNLCNSCFAESEIYKTEIEKTCSRCGEIFLGKKYDKKGNINKKIICRDCWAKIAQESKDSEFSKRYPAHLKHQDPLIEHEARWLWDTGRKEKAEAALRCANWEEYQILDRKYADKMPTSSSILGTQAHL